MADVVVDGALRQRQPAGNGCIGQASGHQTGDLPLPIGELRLRSGSGGQQAFSSVTSERMPSCRAIRSPLGVLATRADMKPSALAGSARVSAR